MKNSSLYDVVILGSGIGGSILACILAKAGLKTLLLEESSHPRFAIGESLIPETGIRLRVLAEKYGVPEIAWLGNFYQLRDNISSSSGVKRSFSFMYHTKGEQHKVEQINQLPTLTPPFGPDSHLFREDTDSYMAYTAISYGAELRQQVKVTELEFGADEVGLLTAKERIRARFLIDAGGMRSLVSTQLGLRDEVPRFKTDTRGMYNHFIGLKPADLLFDQDHKMPSPIGQSTMHHIFDGGWLWIIPFNNHRESTNPLASVGLMLDRRKYPEPQGTPAEEFRHIISQFPSIARHFAEATEVRPWIGTGRLQYSQTTLTGPRFVQLPHAASFVDPLFSSGLSVLTIAVDLIAQELIPACRDNDFRVERFKRMEDTVNQGFDHYDHIISRSLDSFASYDLWNAWNRNWTMGNYLGTFGPLKLLLKYEQTGDRRYLDMTTEPGRVGVLSSHLPEVLAAMTASSEDIAAAVAGQISHAEASNHIFTRLGQLDFLPPYMGFGRPEQHAPTCFTLPWGMRHVIWYNLFARQAWKDYVSFNLLTYARLASGFMFEQVCHNSRRLWAAVRDVFFVDNREWRYQPRGQSARGKHYLPVPTSAQPKQQPDAPAAAVDLAKAAQE